MFMRDGAADPHPPTTGLLDSDVACDGGVWEYGASRVGHASQRGRTEMAPDMYESV